MKNYTYDVNEAKKDLIKNIQMIEVGHATFQKNIALQLAKEWNNTDEKWSMVCDHFGMTGNECDKWIDFIEDQFIAVLENDKTADQPTKDNTMKNFTEIIERRERVTSDIKKMIILIEHTNKIMQEAIESGQYDRVASWADFTNDMQEELKIMVEQNVNQYEAIQIFNAQKEQVEA